MMDEVIAGLDDGPARLFCLTGFYGEAPAPVALLRSTWERLGGEGFDEAFGEFYELTSSIRTRIGGPCTA